MTVIDTTTQIVVGAPTAKTYNVFWTLGMSLNEQQETVSLGDEIVFAWTGLHNVYKFPTKAAFDACDFSDAAELAPHSQNDYVYKANEVGTFFFSCEIPSHCELGQKLALTVTSGMILRG